MPRASWKGFLRLSLVSCPVYLSPATTRAKAIRLHQVRRARPEPDEDAFEEEWREREPVSTTLPDEDAQVRPEPPLATTRITIRPHDPHTGEELDKAEVVKGYEFERGQFVTLAPDELKNLEVESSKIIDLERFVLREAVDPVYFSTPYYVYPDGPIAAEAFRVIGAAMAEAGRLGIGRVTIARRERMITVEPRGSGMVLFTLRAADEVRAADFGTAHAEIDDDMVAVARTIIEHRAGEFDPASFRDSYQEALRMLIEAKMKGLPVKSKPVAAPSHVIDLMAALKRSLAQENTHAREKVRPGAKRRKSSSDRRQAALLFPVAGGKDKMGKAAVTVLAPSAPAPRRRKKA